MHNIAIHIDGLKKRRKSAALLHIIAGFFLLASAAEYFKLSGYTSIATILIAFTAAFVSLAYGLFRQKIDAAAKYNTAIRSLQAVVFLLLAIFSFVLLPASVIKNYSLLVWVGICMALLITERKLFQNPLLQLNQQHITLPGYAWNKQIDWNEIENIIVRTDFITIYYPDNRYTQYEVANHYNTSELETINNYCRQQLQSALH